jgi:hypothetical protein
MKFIISLLTIFIFFSSFLYAYTPDKIVSEDEYRYYILKEKPKTDSWNTQDTILELGFLFVAGLDLYQTYRFLYIDKDGQEKNSIPGKNPSKKKLFLVSGLWGAGHIGVSYMLPKHWLRATWQLSCTFIHLYCIGNSYQIGVGFKSGF